MPTVGLEIGVANIQGVLLSDDERVLAHTSLRTPPNGDRASLMDVLEAAAHAVCDEGGTLLAEVDGVGVGAPGVVIDGTVGGAANVPGLLERFGLAELLEHALGRPIAAVNDVTAAALAEQRLGAGRGSDDVLAVFVGTGVGGGIILGGRPELGGAGGAGELGHMIVDHQGAVCPCGRRGCVEAYAGRAAMERTAARRKIDGEPTILFEVQRELERGHATSGVFLEALQRGDGMVADLIDDAVWALGCGIASAVNLLDVDRVVLGGGLADRLGDPFRLRVDAATRPLLFLQPARVQVVAAELGAEVSAIGAALHARSVSA